MVSELHQSHSCSLHVHRSRLPVVMGSLLATLWIQLSVSVGLDGCTVHRSTISLCQPVAMSEAAIATGHESRNIQFGNFTCTGNVMVGGCMIQKYADIEC